MGQSPLLENEQATATDVSVLSSDEKAVFIAQLKESTSPVDQDQLGSLLNLDQSQRGLVHRLCLVASDTEVLNPESLLSATLLLSQRLLHCDYGIVLKNAFGGSDGKVDASKIQLLLNLLLQRVAGTSIDRHSNSLNSREKIEKCHDDSKPEPSSNCMANVEKTRENDANKQNIPLDSDNQQSLENDFASTTMSLLRFIDPAVSIENIGSYRIDAEPCVEAIDALRPILTKGFVTLFSGLFEEQTGLVSPAFAGTPPMTDATRALISMALSQTPGISPVTPHNLVKLFDGSSAGFSLRSLETCVLKWQAPSILLISGKRLSRKTRSTNRRYLQFEERFPPIQVSNASEENLRKGDIITIAVYFELPWKKSEKTTFGNQKTTIISLLPVFDMFKAKDNQSSKSFASFSSFMGIGIGNDQPPLAKPITHSQPYLAGDISLSIEPNLEYAVWRHLGKSGNSCRFSKGLKVSAAQDSESRISIRSIQVWGIGSDEQLAEQKRQWAWENQQAEARQNINVDALGDDRAFLEMAGLVGNHGAGGLV